MNSIACFFFLIQSLTLFLVFWKSQPNLDINLNLGSYQTIHIQYYGSIGACGPTNPPVVEIPPFATSRMIINDADNNPYQDCQVRFSNPNTLQLWSTSNTDESAPRNSPCNGGQRIANDISISTSERVIVVSPIPTSDIINIQKINVGDIIYLYDVLGNILMKQRCDSESLQLNISTIPPGVYFVKSQNSEAVRIVKII